MPRLPPALLAALACTARAAAAADPTRPAFRLPSTVRARAAAIDLTLRPDADRFQGAIDLDTELAEDTGVVWLHAENLTPREATIGFGGRRLAAIKDGRGSYDEVLAHIERTIAVAAIQRPSLHAWLERGKPRQPAPRR